MSGWWFIETIPRNNPVERSEREKNEPLHKWSSLEVSNNNSVMLVLLYSVTVFLLSVIVPEKVVSVRVL